MIEGWGDGGVQVHQAAEDLPAPLFVDFDGRLGFGQKPAKVSLTKSE